MIRLAIICAFLVGFTQLANAAKPVKNQAKAAAEKPAAVRRFTGMTLKGQLKKPELSYSYKRSDLQSEQLIEIPENFNDSILQDAVQLEP